MNTKNENTIVPPTLGGSYVYMANTAAAFLGKKAYPYSPAPPPSNVEFKKYTLDEAADLDLDRHSREILQVYDPFVRNKKFSAIIFGSPNGAIVNLAVAMGLPYLCSQFRIPTIIEQSSPKIPKDDLTPYARAVDYIGKKWTDKYRWGTVSCLVDPIHDRMDLGNYAHVRQKFTDIPDSFKRFLIDHLEPNGTIIFVNSTYPWLSHRISDKVYLQVGGLGEISANEYIHGSERIDQFLKEEHSEHRGGWSLPDYGTVRMPESEWGTQSELQRRVQEYCTTHGYQFLSLEHNHPADFNLLASHALHLRHTADGGRCGGYSINIFWGLCPTFILRTRMLGCWFTFTDKASLTVSAQQMRSLLDDFPDVPKKAVMGYYWSYPDARLLDIVPPSGWVSMLSDFIPEEDIVVPGLTDLDSTEHDIFQYEDVLFQESVKFEGKESKHQVTLDELKSMLH